MLDEHIRFSSMNHLMYAIPLTYRVSSKDAPVSIARLRRALHTITIKHNILSTALYFDQNGLAMQNVPFTYDCGNHEQRYSFTVIDVEDDVHLHQHIDDLLHQSSLFDLEQ